MSAVAAARHRFAPGTRRRWGALLAAACLLAAALALAAGQALRPGAAADPGVSIRRGKDLYRQRCASCHGRSLQGQPLWQVVDRFAGRRAPALDRTGRSWQRSDPELFALIRDGHRAGSGHGGPDLDDRDVLAVMAFVEAEWPVGLRVLHAIRNPGRAGMPANAGRPGWTFPSGCPF